MRFPHAHRGVKLIFIAEIVALASAVVALIAAVFVSIASSGNTAVANSAGTMLLVASIASIVVFVIQLVGLIIGAKDSHDFRIGLIVTIVGLAAAITSAVLQSLPATKGLAPIVFAILDTVATVADLIVIICILFGISSLAAALGNGEMEEQGRKLAFYIVIIYIVSLILGLMPGFNGYVNPGIALLFSIFSIAAAVIEIFIYVTTIIYLYRATHMLEE